MSSHHVVKAKQEPALIILDLHNFDEEYLGQILEWSPTLLVSAAAYDAVDSLGIKIDVVLGSAEATQGDVIKLDVQISDIASALSYLLLEGYPAANIINSEVLPIDSDIYDAINLVWFCSDAKIYRVKSGFSVWKSAGTVFKLSDKNISTTNLRAEADGIFEVIDDGFVTFKTIDAHLFIEERL